MVYNSFAFEYGIFVDRATKPTLAENMKQTIAVERWIIYLDKKNANEERKSKKFSFKDDSKKKTPRDPYDMEGLQKVLKTMSNEMVEIKKQVAETSTNRPFRKFKRNQTTESKPPNSISNAESDLEEDEEEDTPPLSEEEEEEEITELHGMWDLILPNSNNEIEQEAMPVSRRSRSTMDPVRVGIFIPPSEIKFLLLNFILGVSFSSVSCIPLGAWII